MRIDPNAPATAEPSAAEPLDDPVAEPLSRPATAGFAAPPLHEPAVTFERSAPSLFDRLSTSLAPFEARSAGSTLAEARATPLETAWELDFGQPQLDFLARVPATTPSIAGAPVDTSHVAPADARAFFDGLQPEQRTEFTSRHPEVVGALDGAPYALRFDANRVLVRRHLDDVLPRYEKELGQAQTWIERFSGRPRLEPREQQILDGQTRLAERLRNKIAVRRSWAEPDRQFMLFDPSGDGRVAEVKGNLDHADHVAVIVPGITNDLDNYQGVKRNGGLENYAASLQDKAREMSRALGRPEEEVASISWLGYDTPDRLIPDATSRSAARSGSDALPRFVEGLELTLPNDPHMTVIGHSYGSLVTGMSSDKGLEADSVVFIGSPGVGAPSAGELGFADGTEIYAARARGDIIGHTPTFIHGPDPADDAFGALSFDTGAAKGHGQYFIDQSLDNLARIQLNID